ncbi:sensor histidine kinase [Pedobacter jamesrossensis]|uniref:sensor histidine kinase n=1 Tax=Pedobacter jamesrossensis TaxID=1908238 RepID=UPI003617DF86
MERLLKEKEWLLREVHHRVKNNLHTVICLLESQAAYLKGDALEAIESSEHRIYAMSLIHQKLYQTDDIKTVDMSSYLPELIGYLKDSFGMQNKLTFSLDIDHVKLGISQAIPISLIVNEAITNSFKYAFTDDSKGTIKVIMKQDEKEIKLIISDNGVGIDMAIVNDTLQSLGLRLMKGLSEDLEADIKFENSGGTKISITFKPDPLMSA